MLTTAYYFPESPVIRVGPHKSTRSSSSSSQPISPAAPSAKYIEYCRPSFIHHQLIEEEDNNQPASVIQGNVVEPEQTLGATAIKVGSGLARLSFSLRLRPPKTKTPPPSESFIGSRGDDIVTNQPASQPATQEAHLYYSTLNSRQPTIKRTNSLPQSTVTPTTKSSHPSNQPPIDGSHGTKWPPPRELAAHGSQLWPLT